MGTSPIDVVIPSYNGRHLLEKNLPYLLKNTNNLGQVIIIDNGSTDNTVSWLQKKYPKIKVIVNSSNLGYTIPINQGIAVSKSDYFILINNDVRPEPGYLKPALRYLNDPQVFAITFNERQSSWPSMIWSSGKMQFTRGEDKSKAYFSPWASGGSALFRRSIWNKLGGLDEIYAPWYWEDIDIGYRAWKSGYKIVWEPRSLVVHDHESTSKKLDPKYVNLIKQRNELLFNWLNVKDFKFRRNHIAFLITYTMRHPGYAKVILTALFRMFSHSHLDRSFTLTDTETLKLFSRPYED